MAMTPQEKFAAIGKTTEGPWYRDVLFIRGADGEYIADIKLDPADPVVEANIRLLTLAPALRRFAERVLVIHMRRTPWIPGDDMSARELAWCEQCNLRWPCPTVQAAQEELGD